MKIYNKKNWHFAKVQGDYITDDSWTTSDSIFELIGIEKPPHKSNCDRCNTSIEYNYLVYNKDYGYKIVGSTCITKISDLDEELKNLSLRLYKGTNDVLGKQWEHKHTKHKTPFIEAKHSHSKLRIYGNGKAIQVAVKKRGVNWYDWTKKITVNKDLNTAKMLSYITLIGLKATDENEKDIIRNFYKEVLKK